MKAAEKDANVWWRIANVYKAVVERKRQVREIRGICHQVFELADTDTQRTRMFRLLESHRPKGREDKAYYFPLTREGARQREKLCRKLSRACHDAAAKRAA